MRVRRGELEQTYASLVPGRKSCLYHICESFYVPSFPFLLPLFVVPSPAGHVAAAGSSCVGKQADTSRVGKVIG